MADIIHDITYEEIDKYLELCYDRKLSVFLHGPPGIGKSAAVKRVAEKLGIGLIDMRLTQMDAVDLRGLPILSNEGTLTGWAPPGDLPVEGKGILFLDELNLAPPSVQHAAYQLILQRKLGNYILPEGWVCFAAGNRAEDRAHVSELPSPLANRFVHLDMQAPPVSLWTRWANREDVNIDMRIIGFLTAQPEWLFVFESNKTEHLFPTPRSWEFCSRLIDERSTLNELFQASLISVGRKAASEFITFIELFSKINAERVLREWEKTPLPADLGELTALITAVALHVKKKSKAGKLEAGDRTEANFLRFICRKDLASEYSVLSLQLVYCETNNTRLHEVIKNNPDVRDVLVKRMRGLYSWQG